MKVALITTLEKLAENKRIEEEVKALGHEFELINLENFTFSIEKDSINVEKLNDFSADLVIVRGIFNSIKPISVLVNNIKKQGTKVFDNNFIEHKYSIDKVTDLIKLNVDSIPIPKTSYSRDFDKYSLLAKAIGYPLIVKSTRTGKGVSIFKIDNETGLKNLVEELKSEDKKAKSYLIQEFIPYKYDLRCLVIGDDVFTMRRIPAEGEFRANFSLGGTVESYELDNEGKELAIKALKSVDMSVGGVDILITEDGKRYILEVNHTAGFVGMEKATDKNIARVYVEHALREAK